MTGGANGAMYQIENWKHVGKLRTELAVSPSRRLWVSSNVLSSRDALDPLSGNAVLNGIPVEVSACA